MARPGATLPPLPPKPANLFPVWSGLLIALFVVITRDLEITFEDLFWGLADMAEFLGRFDHPDFTELPRYLRLMGETLAMAAWGTALSLAIAVVAAPFAARNLSPSPIIYRIVREALNLLRAIPDLLLALIFVAALGLGPLAGTLALGLHTAGFLGKFFAECLERVDPGAYEAAYAAGAGFLQTTVWIGWPSIIQEVVGYTIFVLDRNVRMAAVLGLVGAGGIGFAMQQALRLFEYGSAAALILVILATIMIIDYLSAGLRARVR